MEGGFIVRHVKRKASAVPMDHALEKAYNKPVKGNIRVFGISKYKDAACRWNTVKHEKAKFKNFLQEWCCLNEHVEYVLYHDYTTGVVDEMFLNAVIECVTKHRNPYNLENSDGNVTLSHYQICQQLSN